LSDSIMRITRLKGAGLAMALSVGLFSVAPAQALPAPAPAGTVAAVKWGAIGVIGVASVLVGYDLVRRFGCTGDFLKLGGPGFTSPARNAAIMTPRCPAR
jgi:hypothetical protein